MSIQNNQESDYPFRFSPGWEIEAIVADDHIEYKKEKDRQAESPWLFPVLLGSYVKDIKTGKRHFSVSGDQATINSYLERFACVPVHVGNQRKLARLNSDGEWTICEPDGSTKLEIPVRTISNRSEQVRILTEYNWYHIGFDSSVIEFEFCASGDGFSRHTDYGWGNNVLTTPIVKDFYWNYSVSKDVLLIKWEDGSTSNIDFSLKNKLQAASRVSRNGGLDFYDMTLEVSSPLFPRNATFAKYLLSDYWGQPRLIEEA